MPGPVVTDPGPHGESDGRLGFAGAVGSVDTRLFLMVSPPRLCVPFALSDNSLMNDPLIWCTSVMLETLSWSSASAIASAVQ